MKVKTHIFANMPYSYFDVDLSTFVPRLVTTMAILLTSREVKVTLRFLPFLIEMRDMTCFGWRVSNFRPFKRLCERLNLILILTLLYAGRMNPNNNETFTHGCSNLCESFIAAILLSCKVTSST